jgi:hypothetical protein
MSLKPGIGAAWFHQFSSDVYPSDEVIVRGRSCRPPRYYDNLFSREDFSRQFQFGEYIIPETGEVIEYGAVDFSPQMEDLKYLRYKKSLKSIDDNTPERLFVRKQVVLARVEKLKRVLT